MPPPIDTALLPREPIPLTMDSATLYEMVSVFLRGHRCHRWAWDAAITLTTALVQRHRLEIAAGPAAAGEATDYYADVINSIIGKNFPGVNLPRGGFAAPDMTAELNETRAWVSNSGARLAEGYLLLRLDRNFQAWLSLAIESAWDEHAGRLKGLFDLELIDSIGEVYAHIPTALKRVPRASEFVSQGPEPGRLVDLFEKSKRPWSLQSDDREAVEHAYVISAIIRGHLHQVRASAPRWNAAAKQPTVTRPPKRQLTRHPFRGSVIKYVDQGSSGAALSTREFDPGDTQTYFSAILLSNAMQSPSPTRRYTVQDMIEVWSAAARKASNAVYEGKIDLSSEGDVELAVRKAVKAYQKLELVPASGKIEGLIDLAVAGAGPIGLTIFKYAFPNVEIPYESEVAKVAFVPGVLATRLKVVDRVKAAVNNVRTAPHLRELAFSGPGVVTYGNYRLSNQHLIDLPDQSIQVLPDGKTPPEAGFLRATDGVPPG